METIQRFEADGAEIQAIIYDTLMPAVDGIPLGHAVLSMLAFSIILMKPDVDMDKLQQVLLDVSQTIILHLSEPPEGAWDA